MEIFTPEQEEERRRQEQEDQERRVLARAPGAGALTPATSPAAGATAATAATPAIARPAVGPRGIQVPSIYAEGAAKAEADKQRMISQGSGISQIKNPILKTLARIGDVAGTALFPRVAAAIPGTELHHRGLIAERTGQVNQGLMEAEKEAQGIKERAAANPKPEKPENMNQAYADAVQQAIDEGRDPNADPRVLQYADAIQRIQPEHQKHPPTIHESDQGIFLVGADGKVTPLTFNGQPLKPKSGGKSATPEQQFIDEYMKKNPDGSIAGAVASYASTTQKPERESKQLAVDGNGNVIELKAGMKVPQGTKPVSKYGEPTADETRRADLARNMNENLDQLEAIVKRRPDLFGPMSGRMTTLKSSIGTDDPDIAALSTIHELMGMAAVGAHAMRNAQHVAAAANAIINAYKNKPDAILASIAAARSSLKTFQDDAAKGAGGGAAETTGGVEHWEQGPDGKLRKVTAEHK